MGIKFDTRLITPDVAESLLENNYKHNRKIRPVYVAQLVDSMNRDAFFPENGQTIVVDKSGVLVDGQHRLNAIILSGKSYVLPVAIVDNAEDVYATIDDGTRRNVADFLDCPNANAVAALSKRVVALRYGEASIYSAYLGKKHNNGKDNLNVCRDETFGFATQHEDELVNLVRLGLRIGNNTGLRCLKGYLPFLVELVRFVGRDGMLDEFIEDINATPQSSAAAALFIRTLTSTLSYSSSRPKPSYIFGLFLNAYEAFRSGSDVTVLNQSSTYLKHYEQYVREARERMQ